jgi:hypothetical protein
VKNFGGLPYRAIQSVGGDVRRKEGATALIQHVTAKIGHLVLLHAIEAGALVSLCR